MGCRGDQLLAVAKLWPEGCETSPRPPCEGSRRWLGSGVLLGCVCWAVGGVAHGPTPWLCRQRKGCLNILFSRAVPAPVPTLALSLGLSAAVEHKGGTPQASSTPPCKCRVCRESRAGVHRIPFPLGPKDFISTGCPPGVGIRNRGAAWIASSALTSPEGTFL